MNIPATSSALEMTPFKSFSVFLKDDSDLVQQNYKINLNNIQMISMFASASTKQENQASIFTETHKHTKMLIFHV